MSTDLITCPSCEAKMTLGGACIECGHSDDGSCTCDHCLMCDDPDDEDDSDDDLDIDVDEE